MVSTPKMPEVQYPDPPPPAPERSDAETQSMAAAQREKFFKRRGRASTMLTGGTGTDGGMSAARYLGGTS